MGLEFIVEVPPQARGTQVVINATQEIIEQLRGKGYIDSAFENQSRPPTTRAYLTSPYGHKVEVGFRGSYIFLHFNNYEGLMPPELQKSKDLAHSAIEAAKSNLPRIFGHHS